MAIRLSDPVLPGEAKREDYPEVTALVGRWNRGGPNP